MTVKAVTTLPLCEGNYQKMPKQQQKIQLELVCGIFRQNRSMKEYNIWKYILNIFTRATLVYMKNLLLEQRFCNILVSGPLLHS